MRDRIGPFLKALPPEVRAGVVGLWEKMPPDVRADLRVVANTVDGFLREDKGALRQVMELIGRTVIPAAQVVSDVVVVGPVNVGKSSLYNAIVSEQAEEAAVSPVPGSTRHVQSASIGPFKLTDTPGAEHWADTQAVELERALQAARDASFMLVVFDASRGVLTGDLELYERLKALGKPHVVALNKMDLIAPRHRDEVRRAAASALHLDEAQVLPVSAKESTGVDRLLLEIAVAEPRLLGYLGSLIPAMRRKLAWQAIRRATTTAMVVALIPLPLVDLVPLAAVQVGLILTVARIFAQPIGVGRAGEVIGTFGFGLLGRTLFHELVKLGGLPGWMLASSIAGATTMSIGVTAMRWFESGRKPTRAEAAKLARGIQGRLGQVLKSTFRRKPKKIVLTQRLEEALPELADILDQESSSR